MCGVGLFCTFQDGICVVWVCFVPFVLFASLLVYKWNLTVPFSQPKTGRKLYCVPIIADHKWNCFVLLKLFLYHNQTVLRISCSRVLFLYQLVQKKFH
jgi:hypothetical protein